MTRAKIYSPLQVALLSGQPIAAVYALSRNFEVLGNKGGVEVDLALGWAISCLVLRPDVFL